MKAGKNSVVLVDGTNTGDIRPGDVLIQLGEGDAVYRLHVVEKDGRLWAVRDEIHFKALECIFWKERIFKAPEGVTVDELRDKYREYMMKIDAHSLADIVANAGRQVERTEFSPPQRLMKLIEDFAARGELCLSTLLTDIVQIKFAVTQDGKRGLADQIITLMREIGFNCNDSTPWRFTTSEEHFTFFLQKILTLLKKFENVEGRSNVESMLPQLTSLRLIALPENTVYEGRFNGKTAQCLSLNLIFNTRLK